MDVILMNDLIFRSINLPNIETEYSGFDSYRRIICHGQSIEITDTYIKIFYTDKDDQIWTKTTRDFTVDAALTVALEFTNAYKYADTSGFTCEYGSGTTESRDIFTGNITSIVKDEIALSSFMDYVEDRLSDFGFNVSECTRSKSESVLNIGLVIINIYPRRIFMHLDDAAGILGYTCSFDHILDATPEEEEIVMNTLALYIRKNLQLIKDIGEANENNYKRVSTSS